MKSKDLAARNRRDLAEVLKTAAGRRLLWRILQAAQTDQHGFVPADPYATAFHCGQRSIGLFLQEQIAEISPFLPGQMRAEYLSEVKSEQNEINRQSERLHEVEAPDAGRTE